MLSIKGCSSAEKKYLTPGGALTKLAMSATQLKSGYTLSVMPHNVTLTRDSLATVPGTTREAKRSLSNGRTVGDYVTRERLASR